MKNDVWRTVPPGHEWRVPRRDALKGGTKEAQGTPQGHPKPAQEPPRANPRPQGTPNRRPRVPRDIERYHKQPKEAAKKNPTTTTPKGDNHNDNHNDHDNKSDHDKTNDRKKTTNHTTRPTTGEKQPTTISRITQHPYDTARRNARERLNNHLRPRTDLQVSPLLRVAG